MGGWSSYGMRLERSICFAFEDHVHQTADAPSRDNVRRRAAASDITKARDTMEVVARPVRRVAKFSYPHCGGTPRT